jgi:5-methylcytosine-specific restriction endonuclease McrA
MQDCLRIGLGYLKYDCWSQASGSQFAAERPPVASTSVTTMPAKGTRKARYALRRKRRMAAVEHDLSAEQWAALTAAWGGCAYCGATGRPLQRDCVLPISRGGRYTLDNIAPACGPCNASKCNDEVTGWLRRKRLDERAFLERHVRVQAALAERFAITPEARPSTTT